MDTKVNGKILNFLYHTQNRRRINPIYGIFTQIGLLYVIAGYILFALWDKGTIAFVFYLAAGLYIYKNKLNYRFYHKDRLYFYHKITSYLSTRTPVQPYKKIALFLTHEEEF